jgi:ADP-heptose:LPS heptosyltransferase
MDGMTSGEAKPAAAEPRFAASRFWRTFPGGMPRRWWLFRLFDVIARRWPVWRARRGLLIVRMDGIGDMVLFRRSLDAYAEAFGVRRDEITLVGCQSWSALTDIALAGYKVIAINEHRFARRPLYRFRVSLQVHAVAAEIAVCDQYFRRPLMADSLVLVSGATRKVVSLPYINEPTRSLFTWYLSQMDRVIDTGLYPTHEVIRHERFLAALTGRERAAGPPVLAWRDAASPLGAGQPYVVLNPGSNEPGRRWPFARYVALAETMAARGYRVAFVGSGDEKPGADDLKRIREHGGFIDLYGKTSLPELMDLMKGAAAVVSNDTGPAHLAIGLGRPTVVIVGGGHFGSFVPYPDGVAPPTARFVYKEMTCYHCFWRCWKRASGRDVFPCVEAVEQDQVTAALDELLAQP